MLQRIVLSLMFLMISFNSLAALKVFACEPEWAALVEELGGEHLDVFSATSALQDPHLIQPRPSLLAKARQADLLICTGASLEEGWLPLLLRQVGNAAIQIGEPGYFMATDYVHLLEKPSRVDPSQGDVHVQGNPHIQTDPRNIGLVAKALNSRLQELDQEHAQFYQKRFDDFDKRWQASIHNWLVRAKSLKDMPIVVSHNNWIYLEKFLGLKRIATLEPRPGIPASSAYLAKVLEQIENENVAMILNAAYQNPQAANWLSKRSDIPVVTLPFTVGGNADADNLFELYDNTITLLLKGRTHE